MGLLGFAPGPQWRHLPPPNFSTRVRARKEIAYGLVIVWALIGIISKQTNTNIITTAEASAIIILIALAVTAILTKLKKQ